MSHLKTISVAAILFVLLFLALFGYVNAQSNYAVQYFSNFPAGAVTSGAAPVDANLYNSGDTVTVLSNVGNLAAVGYTFLGWEVFGETNPPTFAVADNVVTPSSFVITSNVNLFGVWIETPVPSPSSSPVVDDSVVGVSALFLLFGVLVIVLLVLAVLRGSVALSVISAVCWFTFAAALFIVADAESVFTGVFAWIAVMLGLAMLMFAVWKALNLLKISSERKKFSENEVVM